MTDRSNIVNGLDLIKPEVRVLSAYTLHPYAYQHKLNQNENPFGYPEELKQKVWERVACQDWARYPDFDLVEITAKLAAHNDVAPEQVLVGNGSNELIYVTLAVTLTRGDGVILPVPTFSLYKLISCVMGAVVHEIQMHPSDNFALPPLEVIKRAQAHRARVVILCTPNNPTATAYPLDEVRRVVAESGALVIIDEAYREFADNQDCARLLDEFSNVVILRTFSKAMAMGGLRVGYAIARPEVAREIHKAKLPYALNSFSEAAAVVALDNPAPFAAEMARIKAGREWLSHQLQTIPDLHVYPSAANFFLVRFERHNPAAVFHALLEREGILVRDVSHYPGLAGHLRLSVGTPEQNRLLVETLRSVMRET
ncbi:MAG: histidinol-phosphate transaminase [Ardenticatenaceae bacterium]|nr:histidinol-phosphate transaminase [Ardenticatenaceae bacterium]